MRYRRYHRVFIPFFFNYHPKNYLLTKIKLSEPDFSIPSLPGCAPLRPGRTYNPHPGIRCVRTVGSLPWGPHRRFEHARYLAQRSVMLEETGNSPPPPSLSGFCACRRPRSCLRVYRKVGFDVHEKVITAMVLPADLRFPPTPRGNRQKP